MLLLCFLLACTSPEPDDSALDPGDSGRDTDAGDTGEPIEPPPEGWPDPWGVLSLGLGCLELEGTGFADETGRADAIAETALSMDVAVLALQDVCRSDGGDDALALLEVALEARSGVSWSAEYSVTGEQGGVERGLALLARGELAEPFTATYVQQGAQERAILGAVIEAGARVFTTQLDPDQASVRELQARSLATMTVASTPELGLILAADFADENRSSAVWAQTGAGFVEDSAAEDDERRHVLHHRAASLVATGSATLFDGVDGPVVSDAPGVAAWYQSAAGESACITEIIADVTVGAGQWVAVRGTDFPLDWSFGQPAWERTPGEWAWVSSEIEDAPFEFKVLLDDETWQVGEDIEGAGCGINSTTPTWEEPDDGVDARDRR
jgi:hypothetical protein